MGKEIITNPQEFTSEVTFNSNLTSGDIYSSKNEFNLSNYSNNKFSIDENKWGFTNDAGYEVASIDTSGNLTVAGNLSSLGTVTQIDTQIFVTSAVSVINNGTGPALIVKQTGYEDIATFFDDSDTALIVKNGGYVGIGTSSPNEKLTVVGNINSTQTVYDQTGNSNNWNSVYSSVLNTSSDWDSAYSNQTNYLPLSGATITGNLTVSNILQIGDGIGNFDLVVTTDGNVGINTETPNEKLTVVGNISSTSLIYDLSGNSNNWNSVYTLVSSVSASWVKTSGGNVTGNTPTVFTLGAENYNNGILQLQSKFYNDTESGIFRIGTNNDGKFFIQDYYNNTTYFTIDANNLKTDIFSFLNVNSSLSAKNVIYDSIGNSNNWNSVYTAYNQNSATYATIQFANNKFFPLSGGTITGNISAVGDYFSGSNKSVLTPQTNTMGTSAVTNIVAVSAIPPVQVSGTLYILI